MKRKMAQQDEGRMELEDNQYTLREMAQFNRLRHDRHLACRGTPSEGASRVVPPLLRRQG